MQPLNPLLHNKVAWDRLAKAGNRFAKPASENDLRDPLASVDGPGWLGKSIAGKKILCLAAGGGRHGPMYAAAGADVTVVDISQEMLALDVQAATKFELTVRTIETSMDDLAMLADQSFDIVIHPVSTCYVPDLSRVFAEVARVILPHGIYVSQHKQPTSLQTSIRPGPHGYVIEMKHDRAEPLPDSRSANLVREPGTQEYVHSLQTILGGICRAGFSITDLIEPAHADPAADVGSFEHRSQFVQPYIRLKAERNQTAARKKSATQKIWSPNG